MTALAGVRVVDLSRLAPGPFCSMLLADFGADVVLVEPPGGATRPGADEPAPWELERDEDAYRFDALRRNKRSIVLDLKDDADRDVFARLVRGADVVLEGFRPGVAARLGASYEECRALNPGIVYCSLSGYGQDGPLAQTAGHDIDYIARAGVLASISSDGQRPAIPLNLLADFAGGGLYAAFAIVLALFHRKRTGEGQRIDLAMTDGALSLMTHAASLLFARGVEPAPGSFFLAGGLPSYDVYRCRDRRWVAVGALEPWFLDDLCRLTGRPELARAYASPELLPELRAHLEAWFAERDGDTALAVLAEGATCAAPVLTLAEALAAAEERGMVVRPDGVPQVGVAPRLSATPGTARRTGPRPGEHDEELRAEVAGEAKRTAGA